ncbi:MAG: DUF4157 domain-containing protein [Actinomycetia bacterium]|nr:DUF4157 domain-containing protein [Actinomycetes bacterium]MCP4961181.1 DUF4157 domain-containing protein [Actinomycetes bacterium]
MKLGRAVRVGFGQVLSVPIYLAYEAIVRLANADRMAASRPGIDDDWVQRIVGVCGDLDLGSIRLVERSRIPTRHEGITFGSTVFVTRELSPMDERDMRLLLHELTHVRQGRRFGRLGMARRYGVEWCRCLSYTDHPLEIEARKAERLA